MKVFLTGVTGLVGSAFVSALIKDQPDVQIVCMSRGNNARTAAQRVEACIREQCAFDGHPEDADNVIKHLTVVEGDVVSFDPEAMSKLDAVKDCDTIFHCAADVNLGKDPTGRTYNINYGGTCKMLELARRLPTKAFHYVSTAYTAGRNSGRVFEAAHPDNGFNNPYEESKYKAEMLVRESGFPFTIYRPAIITGRRSDGRVRRPLAFYRIVEFIGKLKKHHCAKNKINPLEVVDMGLHFQTMPVDRIFFVPIDFVCEAITKLFQKPVENRTYHVTGDSPVSTMQIHKAVCSVLRVGGVTITSDAAEEASADDKLTTRFLGDLLPYFSSEVIFDQTNIRAALGDEALDWETGDLGLRKMIESYFEDFFGNVEWIQELVKASRAERGE